jgi:deoxyribodipyrimidine photo-lyase
LENKNVLSIFIFDSQITSQFDKNDPRITFIYNSLKNIHHELIKHGSHLEVFQGNILKIWEEITQKYQVASVYCNEDYEPYAIKRDLQVKEFLKTKNIIFHSYKDQLIFSPNEVLKDDGKPYTVFTPYSKKWKFKLNQSRIIYNDKINFENFIKNPSENFPSLDELGFIKSTLLIPNYSIGYEIIKEYDKKRDFLEFEATSNLGIYLRFGVISIRYVVNQVKLINETFLNELIWREFFMQILYHFPDNQNHSFKKKYDLIPWRNNLDEFEKWKNGITGYPIVDAGMRELNQTGKMHNRVRMIVASFLCKYLLIDWKLGESYFAQKLLDYELSSNNGNWQWCSGSGCDAAPYFRIFNPSTQTEKFDKNLHYIKKWIPELNTFDYPKPIIEHSFARNRALEVYKKALES